MGELIDLESLRRRKAADQAFSRWMRRVGHQPGPDTKLSDLPDRVLADLADLGSEATLALYDLVLGVRGWGAGERFHYLEAKPKVEALDSFLFVADQVRFELMRRLDWVEGVVSEHYPLVDLALHFDRIQTEFEPSTPQLTTAYPRYVEVRDRLRIEPAAVVRSLIPQALKAFHQRLSQGM